jgi:RNA polymerase sigma factor (TIGR02999 family)
MNEVTRILSAIEQGDAHAAEQLLPLVYDELCKLAAQKLAQEKPGQTLQATALVYEAYLRLVGADPEKRWNGRGHFFAAAAEAMRRILIESACRKDADKRGAGLHRVSLVDAVLPVGQRSDDLLALGEALTPLEQADRQAAEQIKLRYFAGMTGWEAAVALGQTGAGTWTFTFSTAGWATGSYTLFAQAEDGHGAFSDPFALNFAVQ